eukprot:Rmarinus@m.13031
MKLGVNSILFIFSLTAYFSMYGVRKTYSAGEYEDEDGLGLELKTGIALMNTAGYATGKIAAVPVLSSISPRYRFTMLVATYLLALLGLLAFAILPNIGKLLIMYLHGIPLAWVWGLVYQSLEGRTMSDALGAGLCFSFIVASGAVKSLGTLLIDSGVDEYWMPFLGGVLFFPSYVMSCYIVEKQPPPTKAEAESKSVRRPLTSEEKKQFLVEYGIGIVILTLEYIVLSAFRDYRDLFSPEIWKELNDGDDTPSAIFTLTEIPVGIVSLLPLAMMTKLTNDMMAFKALLGIMALGCQASAIFTLLFEADFVGPEVWMISMGAALYFIYVPYNCILFDRMFAAFKVEGTCVFVMYLSDSAGYLGSFGVLLYNNFNGDDDDDDTDDTEADVGSRYTDTLKIISYLNSIVGGLCFACAYYFFSRFDAPEPIGTKLGEVVGGD